MERVIRFLVVSILVLPLSFTVAQAQEEKNVSFAALVETRIGTDVLEYGSFSTADIGVHLGVSFLNRVSLTIPFEVMVGFYEAQRIFDENATIGISVGYDVLPKEVGVGDRFIGRHYFFDQ